MRRATDDLGATLPRWLLISAAPPPPAEALLVVDALHRLGARSVEREGGRVVALFPRPHDPRALSAEVELVIRASTSTADPDVTWRWLGPEEWTARWGSGAAPRRVSDRLVVAVAGSAESPAAATGGDPRVRVVRVEPSTAFGSAEHATTRACLRLLDRVVREGDRVLDVGAGSGILSIAAVLLGADRALALEADPGSCAAARRNVALNEVEARVRVEEAEVRPGSLRRRRRRLRRRRWHGIVSNLQAAILRPLLPDLAGALAPGGWLIVSGVLRAERDGVVEAGRRMGLHTDEEGLDDGWWSGRLSRPQPRSWPTGAPPSRR